MGGHLPEMEFFEVLVCLNLPTGPQSPAIAACVAELGLPKAEWKEEHYEQALEIVKRMFGGNRAITLPSLEEIEAQAERKSHGATKEKKTKHYYKNRPK